MNRIIRWTHVVALQGALAGGLAAQTPPLPPPSGSTSVTLFRSGDVLVRRTLPVAIPAGTSIQILPLGLIDESSLTLLDPGVSLVRIRADQTWSEDALLRRNIGRTFAIAVGDTVRRATLLAMDPERWEWVDARFGRGGEGGGEGGGNGGVVFGRPGHVIWPSELVPGARQVDVTLESDRARAGLRVMYTAPGGSWDASYRLFTGARSRFEGVATVSAGPLDLPDAAVQLLAGDIGNYGRSPRPIAYAKMAEARAAMAVNTPSVESVGEAHLYTLPVAVSFMPGMELVVPLFDPVAVQTERRYVVPGALSYYGGIGAGRDEQTVPVEVSYHLAHAHGTPFGDLPLPAGTVSVFAADRRGAMQLVGRGNIDHTAAGEDLDIDAGTAFDITAKRAQIEYALTKIANPQGGATEAKISYRVTIQNAKDSAVTVAVREDRSGDWAVITSSIPARKVSSTRQVFMVPVPPKGTTVLTYTVRVTW